METAYPWTPHALQGVCGNGGLFPYAWTPYGHPVSNGQGVRGYGYGDTHGYGMEGPWV